MKVSYEPLKKIIIHNLAEKTYEEFVNIHAIEGENRPLWCNGLLIQVYTFHENDQIVADRINGILRYYEVSYCECQNYPGKISRKDQSFELPVHNMENEEIIKNVVKFIKNLK